MSFFKILSVILISVTFVSAAEMGQVQVYIFKPDNSIFSGVEVQSLGKVTTTDESGFASLSLPVGVHQLSLSLDGEVVDEIKIRVEGKDPTELILTLGGGGRLMLDAILDEAVASETPLAHESQKGALSGEMVGVIVDAKSGEPVADARVFVRGAKTESRSGADGSFALKLPVGMYAISIIHPDYTSLTLEKLMIVENRKLEVKADLLPSAVELEGISIVAVKISGGMAALVEEKRESKKLLEIVGAEQMSKSGDSNAASALKRVTGITIVDGKFVYVRGMGERYSSTLMNGLSLPSPILERRVVPLDMFPSDVIDSLVVQKTNSADQPGEFGGGLVQIRTKSIPENPVFKLSFSTTYNTESTFKEGLTYAGGDLDFLGFDDGHRDLPVQMGGVEGDSIMSLSVAERESIGESLGKTWTPENGKNFPKGAMTLTYGNKIDTRMPIGFFSTFSYANGSRIVDTEVRDYSGSIGQRIERGKYTNHRNVNSIDLGGMISVGTTIKDNHEVSVTSLLMRTSEKRAEQSKGMFSIDLLDAQQFGLAWVEQQLFSNALHGEHRLWDENLVLNWDAAFSEAERDVPDWRYYTINRYDTAYVLENGSNGTQFQPSYMKDSTNELNFSLSTSFETKGIDVDLKTGMSMIERDRETYIRMMKFLYGNSSGGYPLELYMVNDNIIGSGIGSLNQFSLDELNRGYEANQKIYGLFAMFDASWNDFVLNAGVRHESSDIKISTSKSGENALDSDDILPSMNVSYKGMKQHQFRLAYSKTVNRPAFNEISDVVFETGKGDPIIEGSKDIEQATIDHYDVRWEYYFSDQGSDSVSLGFFTKSIDSPIELFSKAGGGDADDRVYANSESAKVTGFEIDLRKDFRFLKESWKDFYLTTNFAFIESEVKGFKEESTAYPISAKDHQLTGQSPLVINFNIGYDNPDSESNYSLMYNYVGERLNTVGEDVNTPDTMMEPYQQLDFVYGQRIRDNVSIKFKVQNILDEAVELTQDDLIFRSFRKGRDISFGLGIDL